MAKPIEITPEMDAAADEFIVNFYSKPRYGLNYRGTIETRHGPKPVSIYVTRPRPALPAGGDASTQTWRNSTDPLQMDPDDDKNCYINVYVPPTSFDFYTPDLSVSKHHLKKIVLHELVHCVDQKLNKEELFNTPWHRKQRSVLRVPEYQKSPDYYNQPWEQDAYMSSEAWDQVQMWKRNGIGLNRAMQEIRDKGAFNHAEKIYKQDPVKWKRYLRALYESVKKIYEQDIANISMTPHARNCSVRETGMCDCGATDADEARYPGNMMS